MFLIFCGYLFELPNGGALIVLILVYFYVCILLMLGNLDKTLKDEIWIIKIFKLNFNF